MESNKETPQNSPINTENAGFTVGAGTCPLLELHLAHIFHRPPGAPALRRFPECFLSARVVLTCPRFMYHL